jgi:hypothetical protein
MEEFTINIRIDPKMESYTGFLPDGWLDKSPFNAVTKNSVLYRLLDHLGLAWRTTGYVASTPSTMVKVCQSATLAYAKTKSPDASIVTWGDSVLGRLSQKVPELVDDRNLRARLMKEIVILTDDFREKRAIIEPEMPLEPMWQEFIGNASFAMTVWASQRIAFVAFYNAYEAFLVDSLKIVLGKPSLRVADSDFMDGLRTALGTDLIGQCWGHQGVSIGREGRHSLSHGSGKPTAKLQGLNHGIEIENGMLQIWPKDNKRLVADLLNATGAFVTAGVKNPSLQAIPTT